MNSVIQHFQRYCERRPWDFCWRITLEGFLVSVLFGIVLLVLLGTPEQDVQIDFPELVVLAVIVAPLWETVLLQALPIWLARLCGARFSTQIISSVVPFFLLHAIEGISVGLCAGLVGGFYLAFTYAHWRNTSRWTAFWTTAVSHCMNNSLAMAILAIVEVVSPA